MRWLHRIRLKDVISRYGDDEIHERELALVPNVGLAMANQLAVYPQLTVLQPFAERFRGVKTLAQFNRVLDELYTKCDEYRIWVE